MLTDSQQRHTRLQKLAGSQFDLDPGQPDIRGWKVKGSMGAVGTVEELIFDEQSGKVRYIVVDLSGNELGIVHRQVLMPIGIAVIDKDDDDVVLPGVTLAQLTALPEYEAERFDTKSEESIRNVFGGLGAGALSGGEGNSEGANDNTLTPGIEGAILDTSATGGNMSDDTNFGETDAALGGAGNFYEHAIYNDEKFYQHRNPKPADGTGTVSLNEAELKVENTPKYHTGIRIRPRK